MGRGGRGNNNKSKNCSRQLIPKKKPKQRKRKPYQRERREQKNVLQHILQSPLESLKNTVVALTVSEEQCESLADWIQELSVDSTTAKLSWIPSSPPGRKFSEKGSGILVTTAKEVRKMSNGFSVFYTGHDSYTTFDRSTKMFSNKAASPETKVILCLWTNSNEPQQVLALEPTMLASLSGCVRHNIHDNVRHYGSYGESYGFGTRGGYDKVDSTTGASFGQYVCKDPKVGKKLKPTTAAIIENWISKVIEDASDRINKFIGGNPVRDGSVMIEAAVNTCHALNPDLRHKIDFRGKTNFTSVYLNIDAGTKQAHNEVDSSYTIISVPPQDYNWTQSNNPLYFNFYYGRNEKYSVTMIPGTDIYFHGFFMRHNQDFRKQQSKGHPYINVSGYGNRRLLLNVQATIKRLTKNNY